MNSAFSITCGHDQAVADKQMTRFFSKGHEENAKGNNQATDDCVQTDTSPSTYGGDDWREEEVDTDSNTEQPH